MQTIATDMPIILLALLLLPLTEPSERSLITRPDISQIQYSQIEKVAWLVGTWENRTANGSIYETWKKTSEKELFGKSYRLEDNDTAVFETIQVIEKESSLFFIPTVKNQNNALPIEFSLKAISENNFAFKNPDHDFPQVISYTRITPDSLVAEVSGTENGAERKLTFSMRRINQ